MKSDWTVLLPSILTAATGMAALVVGVFVPRRRDGRPILILVAAAGLILSGWPLLGDLGRTALESAPSRAVFGGAAIRDGWGSFLQALIWFSLALTVLTSGPTLNRSGIPPGEFFALLFLGASGMMLLSVSHNLMMLFLSIEILSLSVVVLAALPRGSERAVEGGIKYFVLGAMASAFLLYGMAMAYGASGRIDLGGIGMTTGRIGAGLAPAALALILVGIAFKMGAAPFHMWVPDAYEGAPAAVTGFMASAVKVAAFGVLLRIVFTAFPAQVRHAGAFLWILAALTILVGNFAAISQTNLKRMLAYSSIGHTGYALMGVVSACGGSSEGLAAAAFYLVVYSAMTLGAFGILSVLGRDGNDLESLASCAGLARRRPTYAAALTVLLVSLAGIPPTAGFFSKFYVFRAAVERNDLGLVAIGLLGALVSAYYYLRPVVAMYMQEPKETDVPEGPEDGERDWGPIAAAAIAIGIVLAIGLFPASTLDLAGRAVAGLVGR